MKIKIGITVGVVLLLVAAGVAWQMQAAKAERAQLMADSLLRIEEELNRKPLNQSACRALIRQLQANAELAQKPSIRRGQVELYLALEQKEDAWELLSASLQQPFPAAEDQFLGARVLQLRHADIGQQDLAIQAAALARQYYAVTQELDGLYLAWIMALRSEQSELQAELLAKLQELHPETVQAKVATAMTGYPALEKGAVQQLSSLQSEVSIPLEEAEFMLAKADIEISDTTKIREGLNRVDLALQTFNSSVVGRNYRALALARLREIDKAIVELNWLLRHHPEHPKWSTTWTRLRQELAGVK